MCPNQSEVGDLSEAAGEPSVPRRVGLGELRSPAGGRLPAPGSQPEGGTARGSRVRGACSLG